MPYFDSRTNNGSLRWSLEGPTGTRVNNRTFNSSDALNLFDPLSLPAGEYTVERTPRLSPVTWTPFWSGLLANLVDWTSFATNTPLSNSMILRDATTPGVKQRFYRAVGR